jgi:SsrA-binding protein
MIWPVHISSHSSANGATIGAGMRETLREEEIKKLIGRVEQRGYTLVALNLHYKGGRIKLEIGLAKGKKQHDKREAEKEKDSKREQQQAMKQVQKN